MRDELELHVQTSIIVRGGSAQIPAKNRSKIQTYSPKQLQAFVFQVVLFMFCFVFA